jgi:hypothetical protein
MNIGGTQPAINETTPLLPRANLQSGNAKGFPTVSSAVDNLLANSGRITLDSLLELYPPSLNETRPIHAIAFRLIVILYVLAHEKRRPEPPILMAQSTLQIVRTSYDQDSRRNELQNIAITVFRQIPEVIEYVTQHPNHKYLEPTIEDVLLRSFTENDKFDVIRST